MEVETIVICPHCGQRIIVKRTRDASDAAIQRYYRARAAGDRRMTLRRIAEQTGYSYDYLRKVKRRYDAEGKWGAKHKATL